MAALNLKRYYEAAKKTSKSMVVLCMVQAMRESCPSGGFLKLDPKRKENQPHWISIGGRETREKVSGKKWHFRCTPESFLVSHYFTGAGRTLPSRHDCSHERRRSPQGTICNLKCGKVMRPTFDQAQEHADDHVIRTAIHLAAAGVGL